MQQNLSAIERSRVLSRVKTAEFLDVSPATLDRISKSGALPPPIQLSPRRIGWQYGTLVDWLAAKAAESSPRAA